MRTADMPKHEKGTIEGEITEVFAHRIVVRTSDGSALADLGPKLAEKASPAAGDKVKLTGERKLSELKVARFERGGEVFEADQDDDGHEPADPRAALDAVTAKGQLVVAEPRRKPKHFEVLAKDRDGRHHEHHVGLDGEIRKSKEGDPDDGKWKLLATAAS